MKKAKYKKDDIVYSISNRATIHTGQIISSKLSNIDGEFYYLTDNRDLIRESKLFPSPQAILEVIQQQVSKY